jgi:hypothetical protein
MNVGQLKKALKGFKNDCEVYLVADWEATDENGNMNDLRRLRSVLHQIVPVEDGMDWKDDKEVLLDFEEERATAIIED